MEKAIGINDVILSGKIATLPIFHHISNNERYYKFFISVVRLSEVEDLIPVIISENVLSTISVSKGLHIDIRGEFLSYWKEKIRKLDLYVLAKEIKASERQKYYNNIYVEGYLAQKGKNRVTPGGKKILDVKIKVYKKYGKPSYIPCIIWALNDKEAEVLNWNDKLNIVGRIQSREYVKVHEDGTSDKKVAYEISITNFFKV